MTSQPLTFTDADGNACALLTAHAPGTITQVPRYASLDDTRRAVAPEYEIVAARMAERLRELERLRAVVLHVNRSLIGHGILDVEHQIECHTETLPETARALSAAIETAHVPVNDLIHEWLGLDEVAPGDPDSLTALLKDVAGVGCARGFIGRGGGTCLGRRAGRAIVGAATAEREIAEAKKREEELAARVERLQGELRILASSNELAGLALRDMRKVVGVARAGISNIIAMAHDLDQANEGSAEAIEATARSLVESLDALASAGSEPKREGGESEAEDSRNGGDANAEDVREHRDRNSSDNGWRVGAEVPVVDRRRGLVAAVMKEARPVLDALIELSNNQPDLPSGEEPAPAKAEEAGTDACPKCGIGKVLESTPGFWCSRRYDGCDWEGA